MCTNIKTFEDGEEDIAVLRCLEDIMSIHYEFRRFTGCAHLLSKYSRPSLLALVVTEQHPLERADDCTYA